MRFTKRGGFSITAITGVVLLIASILLLVISEFSGITGMVTLNLDNVSEQSINNEIVIEFSEKIGEIVYFDLQDGEYLSANFALIGEEFNGSLASDVQVDILNDGVFELELSGDFNSEQNVEEFSDILNPYIENCGLYPCNVPVLIKSQTPGTIKITNLVLSVVERVAEENITEEINLTENVTEEVVENITEEIVVEENMSETKVGEGQQSSSEAETNVSEHIQNQTLLNVTQEINLSFNKIEQKVVEEVLKNKRVRVIVILKEETEFGVKDIEQVKEKIKVKQEKVLEKLKLKEKVIEVPLIQGGAVAQEEDVDFELKNKYKTANALSGFVTESGLAKLEADPNVEKVILDPILSVNLEESVPLIKADEAWTEQINDVNLTGEGEVICILDTGIDYNHPDLDDKVTGQYCYCSASGETGCCNGEYEGASAFDDNGHGTHVAGIAAADGALKGVAPGADIVAIKVCDSNGDCAGSDILAGIDFCVANQSKYGISVISISIGDAAEWNSTSCPDFFDSSLELANEQGIFVAAASGNEGYSNGINYPACSPYVTAVGATDKNDYIAGFTNVGDKLDLLAPGVDIYSTLISGYGVLSGTSMATPHVAGAAAIVMQKMGDVEVSEVETALKDNGVSVAGSKRIDVLETVDNVAAGSFSVGAIPTHDTPLLNATSYLNLSADNLTCYNQSTEDGDGDSVKNIYNWKLNGSSIAVLNMPIEASSGTYLKDYSGNGNNGTIGGNPVWSSSSGYDGFGAYDLDGTDDYLYVPNAVSLTYNTSLAIWMKLDTPIGTGAHASYPGIIADAINGYDNYISFANHSSGYYVRYEDSTGSTRNGSSFSYNTGDWIHVAIVMNASRAPTFYINGVNKGSDAVSSYVNINYVGYGYGGATNDGAFDGKIDEVLVFNKSLSAEQILALYNNRTDLIVSNETGLHDVWTCEVTPNDGEDDGETKTSNSLTILDVPAAPPSEEPNSTEFNSSYGSTNFSAVDVNNVTSLTLANQFAVINFTTPLGVNASGEDYDTNILLGEGFISVNTLVLDDTFNRTANITLKDIECTATSPIYYKEGGNYETSAEIILGGGDCVGDGVCTNVVCNGTQISFEVSHFTGFAVGTVTNLTIWDETDPEGGSQTKGIGEKVVFFANYTNATGIIDGANCTINFSDSTDNLMILNVTSQLYEYNRSFSSSGNFGWNVTCNLTAGENLTAADTVVITGPLSVTLISPNNYTGFEFGTDIAELNCSATGNGLINLTLYVWNSTGDLIFTNVTLASGNSYNHEFEYKADYTDIFKWNCEANETSNAVFADVNNTFIIYNSSIAPVIQLINPENNSMKVKTNVTFIFLATSIITSDLNCSVVLDGQIIRNILMPSGRNYTSYNVADGNHNWSVFCLDNESNPGVSGVWNFTVDTSIIDDENPFVELILPSNGKTYYIENNLKNVTLMYNVTDDYGDLYCTLWTDINGWGINETHQNYPVGQGETISTRLINLGLGIYEWNVNCTDSSGNESFAAANYTFTIAQPGPCDCDSCDNCTTTWNSLACSTVRLIQDISHAGPGVCVNKTKVEGEGTKTFDGQDFHMDGDEDGTGILLSIGEPMDIFLVMDVSGSMAWDNLTRLNQSQDAAQTFVDAIPDENHKVGLVKFSSTATLVSGLEGHPFPTVIGGISGLFANGSTSVGAGMQIANSNFGSTSRPKIVILLSDGEHNTDPAYENYAFEAVNNDITYYTISYSSSGDGFEDLEIIADATGGISYVALDAAGLNQAYTDIADKYFFLKDHTVKDINIGEFDYGIKFSSVQDSLIDNVNTSDNDYFGIQLSSCDNITVSEFRADNNGPSGGGVYLTSTDNSIVRDCVVSGNELRGVYFADSDDNSLINCTIANNYRHGVLNDNSDRTLISENLITNNAVDVARPGLLLDGTSANVNVTGNNISANNNVGFDDDVPLTTTKVYHNRIDSNGGVGAGGSAGITFVNNTANNNSGTGFATGQWSTLIGNTANGNVGNGITVSHYGSIIKDNTANNNTGHGIQTGSDTEVYNNTANYNERYGIDASGDSSFVKDNNAHGNEVGIYLGHNTTAMRNNATYNTLLSYYVTQGNSQFYPTMVCSQNIDTTNIGGDGGPFLFINRTNAGTYQDASYSEVILCNATNTILDNIVVSNPVSRSDGIILFNGRNVIMKNSNITDTYIGLYLRNSDNAYIANNTIDRNAGGVYNDYKWDLFYVYPSLTLYENKIRNNNFNKTGNVPITARLNTGFYSTPSSFTISRYNLTNNLIESHDVGIDVSGRGKIINNTLFKNNYSIMDIIGAMVHLNNISNSTYFGIITNNGNNNITNNTFRDNNISYFQSGNCDYNLGSAGCNGIEGCEFNYAFAPAGLCVDVISECCDGLDNDLDGFIDAADGIDCGSSCPTSSNTSLNIYYNYFYNRGFSGIHAYSGTIGAFNTYVLGEAQGNFWDDTTGIYDSNHNIWGDYGPQYPYSNIGGELWSPGFVTNYAADYGPIVTPLTVYANGLECEVNALDNWVNCTTITYDDTLLRVRANCTDTDAVVTNATFNLTNIPDSNTFFNENATSVTSDWWIYDNADIFFKDGGEWNITVVCVNNNSQSESLGYNWSLPWGTLNGSLITTHRNITQNLTFNFQAQVTCVGGECGNITSIADPEDVYSVSTSCCMIHPACSGGYEYCPYDAICYSEETCSSNCVAIENCDCNAGGDCYDIYGDPITDNCGACSGCSHCVGLEDEDGDGVVDSEDTLSGNESDVTISGIVQLNITINNTKNNSPSGNNTVKFSDGQGTLFEFDFVFNSTNKLNMSVISIVSTDEGLYVEGLPGISKTLFIPHNSDGICVKNAAGTITDAKLCNGTNETLFGNNDCDGTPKIVGGASVTCTYTDDEYIIIGLTSSGGLAMSKGVIPMNSGDPFYTTSQNPDNATCTAMYKGDVCPITWVVNATGNISTTWKFFTIFNATQYLDVGTNYTEQINITIVGSTAVVDTNPPIVNLIAPANGTVKPNTTVDFIYEVYDDLGPLECRLWNGTDGGSWSNYTNWASVEEGQNAFSDIPFGTAGYYIWNVECRDTINEVFATHNFTLIIDDTIVDTEAPDVALIAPPNESIKPNGTIDFVFRVYDNYDPDCRLWTDRSGAWAITETWKTVPNGQNFFMNIPFADNGTYEWNVECKDGSDNSAFAPANWTFTIDDSINDVNAPNVTLIAPPDGFTKPNTTVDFIYNVTDDYDPDCRLWSNYSIGTWDVLRTWISVANGTNAFANIPMPIVGIYLWSVECRDASNNYAFAAENFTLILDGSINDVDAPNVTLLTPNGSNFTTNDIKLNYSVVDNYDPDCTLYSNISQSWGPDNDYRDQTVANGAYSIDLTVPDGYYLWNVYCIDGSSNAAFAESNYTFSVGAIISNDTEDPKVYLTSPANGTTFTLTNNITLNVTATDDSDLDNCTLWTNATGTWAANGTRIFSGLEDSDLWNLVDLANGTYIWNAYCCDSNDNCAWNSSNSTFNIEFGESLCGNGFVEPGETCDLTNFSNLDCTDFDNFQAGSLSCSATCQINTSACTGGNDSGQFCGDGIIQVNETCDNISIGVFDYTGLTCLDFDTFGGGNLACTDCLINTTNCSLEDVIPPKVYLTSPANETIFTSTNNVTLNVTATDDGDLDNCTLWANITGTWAVNDTKIFAGLEDSDLWNFYNLTNGTYIWNAYCCDSVGLCAWNSSNSTFSIEYSEGVIPPAPSPGGDGAPDSVSVGGGARPSICGELWNCTDWSVCYPNGTMWRYCYDVNRCDQAYNDRIVTYVEVSNKPYEVQDCMFNGCSDGLRNWDETDIDCGGKICPGCQDGEHCYIDDDCINSCNETIEICYSALEMPFLFDKTIWEKVIEYTSFKLAPTIGSGFILAGRGITNAYNGFGDFLINSYWPFSKGIITVSGELIKEVAGRFGGFVKDVYWPWSQKIVAYTSQTLEKGFMLGSRWVVDAFNVIASDVGFLAQKFSGFVRETYLPWSKEVIATSSELIKDILVKAGVNVRDVIVMASEATWNGVKFAALNLVEFAKLVVTDFGGFVIDTYIPWSLDLISGTWNGATGIAYNVGGFFKSTYNGFTGFIRDDYIPVSNKAVTESAGWFGTNFAAFIYALAVVVLMFTVAYGSMSYKKTLTYQNYLEHKEERKVQRRRDRARRLKNTEARKLEEDKRARNERVRKLRAIEAKKLGDAKRERDERASKLRELKEEKRLGVNKKAREIREIKTKEKLIISEKREEANLRKKSLLEEQKERRLDHKLELQKQKEDASRLRAENKLESIKEKEAERLRKQEEILRKQEEIAGLKESLNSFLKFSVENGITLNITKTALADKGWPKKFVNNYCEKYYSMYKQRFEVLKKTKNQTDKKHLYDDMVDKINNELTRI